MKIKYEWAGVEVSKDDYEFIKGLNKKDRKRIVANLKGEKIDNIKTPYGKNYFNKKRKKK